MAMPKFFNTNIDRTGRIIRGSMGGACLVSGIAACFWNLWAGIALVGSGVFMLFEAFRGWCVMRACGVKTKY